MKFCLNRPSMPVAAVVLAAAIGFLGYNLGSPQAANATNTASPVNIADPTHPDNLAIDTLSPISPIVMDPPNGEDECVTFSAVADTGTSTGQVHVSATGFVASGTYTGPHGTG